LLLELEKAVSVLELDPSNNIRKYYWKYIDDKKIDCANENQSNYLKSTYITGLFTTFKNNDDFCLSFHIKKKAFLIIDRY